MFMLIFYSTIPPTYRRCKKLGNQKKGRRLKKLEGTFVYSKRNYKSLIIFIRTQRRIAREADGDDGPDIDEPEEEEIEVVEEVQNDTLKQAVRGGPYAMCRKAGLGKIESH
jgi:hypothetical protein